MNSEWEPWIPPEPPKPEPPSALEGWLLILAFTVVAGMAAAIATMEFAR